MTVDQGAGWAGIGHGDFADLAAFRRRLEGGADPLAELWGYSTPLHAAAQEGSPGLVRELAARAGDVDALCQGRSALWNAVYHHRDDNALVLAELGADPWRSMMNGWSPGRLSLAGPFEELFEVPDGQKLTEEEEALADSGADLAEVFSEIVYDGFSVACVAGLTAVEVLQRLSVSEVLVEDDAPWHDLDICDDLDVVGVTGVPGGCVITQPWGYRATRLVAPVTAGTFGYGMYANPKSGNQGCIAEDGHEVARDLHPGFDPDSDSSGRDVLAAFASDGNALVHCLVYAGLHPESVDCLERPDAWVRLDTARE
ncbi:ankyrin repeat domain-containing protein [Actinomadura darangshiensis]|uniref:Ankyrin repeat domain-containing protein n=1 Tax=Actinomadura darangshiensis TaxID=705336 RepID=A0A4R5BU26_9ACTN|nr:ankyrin repeat domain-containing protein [Actinomadura darangshiensis]TDD87674.1 ankyrin repeat domain-containing protein [Actinomadura darangshiensis]